MKNLMKKQKLVSHPIVLQWILQIASLLSVQVFHFSLASESALSTKLRAFLDYDDSDGHIGSFSPAYGDQYPDIIITDDSYDSSYDLEDIDVQYT